MLFHYVPGRGEEHPLKFLAGYRGQFLQCDAPPGVDYHGALTRHFHRDLTHPIVMFRPSCWRQCWCFLPFLFHRL
ncbi:MAG: hypothetical protein ACK4VZ_16150 [Paracoccaceae bacterium]